jgi:SsrA-binding protein
MAASEPPAGKIAAQNRRARHDYLIEQTVEAGIVLAGTEVKSLRTGQASIAEAFAREDGGELFLVNAHIPEYQQAHKLLQHEVKRPRKLLLHRKEMARLMASIKREGVTIVPLSIYFNPRGMAKVQLGLAKGKRMADKRQAAKERDWQRDKARLMRNK